MALPFIRHLIGYGRYTLFLPDPWLCDGQVRDLFPNRIISYLRMGEFLWVHQLISLDGWQLPPPTCSDLISLWQMVENEICPQPLFANEIVWIMEENGQFSLKSAHSTVSQLTSWVKPPLGWRM